MKKNTRAPKKIRTDVKKKTVSESTINMGEYKEITTKMHDQSMLGVNEDNNMDEIMDELKIVMDAKSQKVIKKSAEENPDKIIDLSKISQTLIKIDDVKQTNFVQIEEPVKKGIKLIIDETLDVILSNTGTIIKKIYHISDIHISRFEDRHKEYMIVFQRLVAEINKDTANSLIVICGDVLHEKNILSPAQLLLTKKFFLMLSNILPCVVIIGNHDISPHGNTIDALTPILKSLRTVNKIFLLLEDKNYYYNNITFGLTTMFANNVTPCIKKQKNINIGLYHGIISGTKTDNDFQLNTGRFNITDFKNHYDYVLLGDIHKHSFLDKEHKMAYAGSLLQNNIGESLLDHGFIKWNLVTGKSDFVRIKNDWGFVRVHCNKDGIVESDLINLPKYPIMNIEYEGITSVQAEKYMTEIRNKYNAKCSLIRTITSAMDIFIGKGDKKQKIIDIDDNVTVINLVKGYIDESKHGWTDEEKLNINKKFREVLNGLEYDYCNKVKKINIKNLQFSNFFNFGENNEIDYMKLSGIVGINGNSSFGKSTAAVDVLLYALFGSTTRGFRGDTINVEKTRMETYIEFDVNDDSYSIKRIREKQGKTKDKDSTERIMLTKNLLPITKSTNIETNEEITKIVCDYNNFVNVSIMLQTSSTGFIDLPNVEKKNFLCKLLKLDVFNAVLSKVKSRIHVVNNLVCEIQRNYENFDTNNTNNTKYDNNAKNKKEKKLAKKFFDEYSITNVLKREIFCLEKRCDRKDQKTDELINLRNNIKNMDDRAELRKQIIKTETILQSAEELAKQYTQNKKEKKILEQVVQLLDSDGLLDNILSTHIVPKLEKDVNDLLVHMADYKISINYVGKQLKISKVIRGNNISVDTMHGNEKFMINMCFKIILNHYNTHIKTGFLIIDNMFNCYGDNNIDKLPFLFNYIKKHYRYATIISHNDRVKKLYDINIDIIKNRNGSQIFYGDKYNDEEYLHLLNLNDTRHNARCSKGQIEWLRVLECKFCIKINHVKNVGEYRINNSRYFADGYCEENNTIFEFNGCFYHGCKKCFLNRDDINIVNGKSYDVLYNQTQYKQQHCREQGYNYIEIWECEWNFIKNSGKDAMDNYLNSLKLNDSDLCTAFFV